MWGRVIIGAVVAVLVATWLAAIWLLFTQPERSFFKGWRYKFYDSITSIISHPAKAIDQRPLASLGI
jgi:membrane protein YdbS with pleckstrin-like domain